MQIKLYQYDKLIISKSQLVSGFSDNLLYFFSQLPNVVGIGFDFNQNNLKKITQKANALGLEPIILTAPKFIKLIENVLITGKKVADVEFTLDIDSEDRQELERLLTMNTSSSLLSFIRQILSELNTFIKNISWYEGTDKPVRLSLYDNGILYINDGIETLKMADLTLGTVVL